MSTRRISRLFEVLGALQSGTPMNSSQLACACGVSQRTIFRDLQLLRESGVDVRYNEQERAYAVHGGTDAISHCLRPDEQLALCILGGAFADADLLFPFAATAHKAIVKLASGLSTRQSAVHRSTASAIAIQFNPQYSLHAKSDEFISVLDAIRARRCVRIHYDEKEGQCSLQTLLSPYRLVFRWQRWYVVGRSSWHRKVRTFELSGISEPTVLDRKFRIPRGFTLNRHFGNAWGVVKSPRDKHRVVIRFEPSTARQIAGVQWHRTQKVVRNPNGSIDFHVTVDGLEEIARWILTFGPRATVLQPDKLRKIIALECEHTLRQYCESDA